jgi:hypothetical protein
MARAVAEPFLKRLPLLAVSHDRAGNRSLISLPGPSVPYFLSTPYDNMIVTLDLWYEIQVSLVGF